VDVDSFPTEGDEKFDSPLLQGNIGSCVRLSGVDGQSTHCLKCAPNTFLDYNRKKCLDSPTKVNCARFDEKVQGDVTATACYECLEFYYLNSSQLCE
jgi:hypothetical protein